MHHATHLPLLAPTRTAADTARSWAVLALVAAGLALWIGAYFLPWWDFTLYAPQYPGGLHLTVALRGIGGDVHEVDMLNHYIGMGHLEDAAPWERAVAPWGLAGLALTVAVLALAGGRRVGSWLWAPSLVLVAGFVADSFYWLHHFGHHLNPRAPLHIPPFTPHLFGAGTIGQFRTVAVPTWGFLFVLAGTALLVAAAVVRSRVCRQCRLANQCHGVCARGLWVRR